MLHIHTCVEECEITKLVAEVDMKTKEQKKAKFIKQGGLCICRISVEKPICIEAFSVGGRGREGWEGGGRKGVGDGGVVGGWKGPAVALAQAYAQLQPLEWDLWVGRTAASRLPCGPAFEGCSQPAASKLCQHKLRHHELCSLSLNAVLLSLCCP